MASSYDILKAQIWNSVLPFFTLTKNKFSLNDGTSKYRRNISMSTELKIWGKGLWKINDKDLRKYLKFVSTKRDNLLLLSPFAIWENQV
jgi:hypothetical protein